MKKYIKKILVFVMSFMFVGNVYAIDITTNETVGLVDTNSRLVTNTGILTISGVVSTDTFAAYKILDTYYNVNTNMVTYEFTNMFKAFLNGDSNYNALTVDDYMELTSGDITSGSVNTTSTLDVLASKFASYVKAEGVVGTDMSVSGTNATGTLASGAYLVLPKTTNKVYAAMVGNLELEADENDWKLDNKTIVAKVSDTSVLKIDSDSSVSTSTHSEGERYTTTLTLNLPTYPTNATNKTLTVKETIPTGADFDNINTVVVKDGDTVLVTKADGTVVDGENHTVGTITVNGREMTIVLDDNYLDNKVVTVTYSASLNDNAVLGSAGNTSTTTLTYANDPYGTGTKTTDPVTATVYTYGIRVNLKNANGDALNNATYDVYADSGLQNKVGTITTGADGKGVVERIKEGTYYLVEKVAPTGYKLDGETKTVTIDNTKDYTEISLTNAKMGLLPSTGGIGTYIFIMIGAIVVLLAIIILLLSKKKNEKDEEKK